MKIEKRNISPSQLTFLIISLIQATTFTDIFIIEITKQNTWIVTIVGFIITLFLLSIYTSLSNKFPGKDLIEIHDIVYGKYLGKALSLLYIFFFWFPILADLRFIADFFATYLFPKIDIIIFISIIVIVTMYAVKKGLQTIARLSTIIALITLISFVFFSIFTIKDLDISNLLPIFELNLRDFIQGLNIVVTIPFGEIILFIMLFPYTNPKSSIKKYSFLGLSIGALYCLIVIIRNVLVLGNITPIHVFQIYQVAKLINVGDIIVRTEVLIALIILFDIFVKICIYYLTALLAITQFLKLNSYKPLIIPFGIITIVLSITLFDSEVYEYYIATNIYPIFGIPFIIIFPIISFIIACIKK
jgi:spore germination protein KB